MNIRDKQNRMLTMALFWEYRVDGIIPVFTVDPEDAIKSGIPLKSLKRLYMSFKDPTEHKFVKEIFNGDWAHWAKIKNNDVLNTRMGINEWLPELEVELRSIGVTGMIEIAKDKKHRSNAAAVKWLAERGWAQRERGRPSAEELEGRARVEEKISPELAHAWSVLQKDGE